MLLLLSLGAEAVAAVYGTASGGFERNLGGHSALVTVYIVHFTRCVHAIGALASIAAILATARLVLEATLCVELLFTFGENEFGAAILAC